MLGFKTFCSRSPRYFVLLLAIFSVGYAFGQSPGELTPVLVQPMQSERVSDETPIDDAVPPSRDRSSELPVSISGDNPLLPLATGGTAVLPGLPIRHAGCSPRPSIRCTGPDYRGCSPRIYYGTNPCDDDPILPMAPAIDDHKTNHWYDHALRMILRKKHVAEAMH